MTIGNFFIPTNSYIIIGVGTGILIGSILMASIPPVISGIVGLCVVSIGFMIYFKYIGDSATN